MKFIKNGPDIPERLLQAHEDGKVIFFSGAGISSPAGLPGFANLVTQLYENLGIMPNDTQKMTIESKQFDSAVSLLESNILGGREVVRKELKKILTPKLTLPDATVTHEALLILSRNRSGQTRLVTTNFDPIFEEVFQKNDFKIARYQAPLLPVPKNRWDGLVYLHGLISSTPTPNELDQLVLSSGDFGLAYLTERWAARFVSELFRNYTVCFVGYSISDPVLRYMMDALAADRLRGESPPEMFAFGGYTKNECTNQEIQWLAKNVTPILYPEDDCHLYLHKTLHAWSDTYRDGLNGKEQIIISSAIAKPLESTKEDDFVGRMLWAISDSSGLPAKCFAELNPVPSLDWLEPLCEDRYRQSDLPRFAILSNNIKNNNLCFSLICRPAHYDYAPWLALADSGNLSSRLDNVLYQIARWLTRHLNDPMLVLWLAKRGGHLHENFVLLIQNKLVELDALILGNKHNELKQIRDSAPNAIPNQYLKTLWHLLLGGKLKSSAKSFNYKYNMYRWLNRFRQVGFTLSMSYELREMLSPRVTIREPVRLKPDNDSPQSIKELVDWEIVLVADDVHSALIEISEQPGWKSILPNFLFDFSMLLRDALDLMCELGGADTLHDFSYISQPSISEHPQNNDYHDWTVLIGLTRDAWLTTVEIDIKKAREFAKIWWQMPYPLFRRLAFFAAAYGDVIPSRQAIDWLIDNNAWWLWSAETRHEAIRLLVALVPRIESTMLTELEQVILLGPPRKMYKEELTSDHWNRIVDHAILLYLVRLESAGAILSESAESMLNQLKQKYPDLNFTADDLAEFPYRKSTSNEWRTFTNTPSKRHELIEWLRQHPDTSFWQEDDWSQRCRNNFSTTSCALFSLTQDKEWPSGRWQKALQAWSEENLLNRSWRYMAKIIIKAPDDLILIIPHSFSRWLQAQAKNFEGQQELFFGIAQRIMELEKKDEVNSNNDSVFNAINHPIGHVADSLLRWWYRRSLEDGQGLPDEIKQLFTRLCDTNIDAFRHGRVLLAAHVTNLFRVDEGWTRANLLPLFDWDNSEIEARCAWEGFLWSPRIYHPLMSVIKQPLLKTVYKYKILGKYADQYAIFLTYVALDRQDTFTQNELATVIRSLPSDGLHNVARTLMLAVEGAGERRHEYWNNRIQPFIKFIWPKARDIITSEISSDFAMLCIAARDVFPEAFEELQYSLQSLPHPNFIVHQLKAYELCSRFPETALSLLDKIIDSQTQWIPNELKACLDTIRDNQPTLESDDRFKKLFSLQRRQ